MRARLLPSSRTRLAILTLVLLGAFALRVVDLDGASVWHDEGWSILSMRSPFGLQEDNTPPGYYALLHFFARGVGESVFALRLGSVFIDLLTVALAAWAARRWAGQDAAVLAAVLLAVVPLHWAYAREIRAYVAVPLLTVAILVLADRLLRQPWRVSWRVWGGLALAELALLYTHNLGVPVIAWLNLVVVAVWAYHRQWRLLGLWTALQAALLAAYLPWLLRLAPSGTALNTPPRLGPGLVWDAWQGYFAPVPAQIGAENALVIGSALVGVLTLLCLLAVVIRDRRRPALLAASQAVLLPVLSTALLHAAHIDFHPRYYVAALPATVLVIVLGVESLPHEHDQRRIAVSATIALFWGVAAASLPDLLNDPDYQHDDFRTVAEYYATLPPEALVVIPYGFDPALEDYYADELDIRAELLGVDLHSDAEEASAAINAALARRDFPARVELLTWYQVPADVRGMYPCLLEAAGQPTGRPFTVLGLSTQGYQIERPLALAGLPDSEADYGRIALAGAAQAAGESVCIETTWRLPAETREDWRVAGRLMTTDPAGWIIARSDTDIRQPDQAPTSDWDAGETGQAYSLLRLPLGAPPHEYAVQVGVYAASDPHGLDRLIDGVPSGKSLLLTTVTPDRPVGASEPIPPREQVAIPVGQDVVLIGHDAQHATLNPGQELRITLKWQAPDDCCADGPWTGAKMALRGDGWEVVQPVRVFAGYSLDWHAFVVPAGASGEAVLAVGSDTLEPVTLATYTLEQTDRLFAPPPYDVPVGAGFTGLATLEGISVASAAVSPDEMLDLTLVWKATGTADASYRVFTHLLSADGIVIAQHDGYPVGETRLTTGWVKGEYLVDVYRLAFLPEGQGYRGPARLEVGFYNPETNYRIPVSGGGDHVILPVEITVE